MMDIHSTSMVLSESDRFKLAGLATSIVTPPPPPPAPPTYGIHASCDGNPSGIVHGVDVLRGKDRTRMRVPMRPLTRKLPVQLPVLGLASKWARF